MRSGGVGTMIHPAHSSVTTMQGLPFTNSVDVRYCHGTLQCSPPLQLADNRLALGLLHNSYRTGPSDRAPTCSTAGGSLSWMACQLAPVALAPTLLQTSRVAMTPATKAATLTPSPIKADQDLRAISANHSLGGCTLARQESRFARAVTSTIASVAQCDSLLCLSTTKRMHTTSPSAASSPRNHAIHIVQDTHRGLQSDANMSPHVAQSPPDDVPDLAMPSMAGVQSQNLTADCVASTLIRFPRVEPFELLDYDVQNVQDHSSDLESKAVQQNDRFLPSHRKDVASTSALFRFPRCDALELLGNDIHNLREHSFDREAKAIQSNSSFLRSPRGDVASMSAASSRASASSIEDSRDQLADTFAIFADNTSPNRRISPKSRSSAALTIRYLFEGHLTDAQTHVLVENLFLRSMPRENVAELTVTQLDDQQSRQRFLQRVNDDGNRWSRVRAAWHFPGDVDAMSAIAANGICCDEEHCACGRYGRGGYVALSAAKANAYADSDGQGGERCMFLVLALPDQFVAQGERGTRPRCTAADCRTYPTEYCFVDPARLHCVCLLTYRWVPTGRREKITTARSRVSHIVPRRFLLDTHVTRPRSIA